MDGSLTARNAAGWETSIASLNAILEDDAPAELALATWRVLFERYVLEFEPTAGSQQGPPETHPAVIAERAEMPRSRDGG